MTKETQTSGISCSSIDILGYQRNDPNSVSCIVSLLSIQKAMTQLALIQANAGWTRWRNDPLPVWLWLMTSFWEIRLEPYHCKLAIHALRSGRYRKWKSLRKPRLITVFSRFFWPKSNACSPPWTHRIPRQHLHRLLSPWMLSRIPVSYVIS